MGRNLKIHGCHQTGLDIAKSRMDKPDRRTAGSKPPSIVFPDPKQQNTHLVKPAVIY